MTHKYGLGTSHSPWHRNITWGRHTHHGTEIPPGDVTHHGTEIPPGDVTLTMAQKYHLGTSLSMAQKYGLGTSHSQWHRNTTWGRHTHHGTEISPGDITLSMAQKYHLRTSHGIETSQEISYLSKTNTKNTKCLWLDAVAVSYAYRYITDPKAHYIKYIIA